MPKVEFAIVECERLKKPHVWCSFAEVLPDGNSVLGYWSGNVVLWDSESGKMLKEVEIDNKDPNHQAWISKDGRTLAFKTSKTILVNEDFMETGAPVQYQSIGKTYFVNTRTLNVQSTLPIPVSEVAFSGDGELLAVVDAEKTVRVIKLETNQEIASRKVGHHVSALAFQTEPAELRIVERDTVRSWNYRTDTIRDCAEAPGSNHRFSPDGKSLLCCRGAYKACTVIVTDTTSWKSEKIGFSGEIRHLSLSPDATKLAIAADNTLVVWNLLENCALLKWKKPHYRDIRHAAFSADGERIACVMNGGQVYLFDFRSGAKGSEIKRAQPKLGELQCLRMVGPDDQMDRDGFDLLNPLPVACPVCKRLDLDFVRSPYVLGKKTESPVDFAPAVAGNFLIRESMKRVLETVASGLCRFHSTIHRRTRQSTPWLLAVPQFTQITSKPSGEKCPKCGEPSEWNDIVELTQNPISKHDVFKAHNWLGDDERNLYFSVRLETLVKKLGLRGMVRSYDCRQEPTSEDLAWINEKLKLLKPAKAVGFSPDEMKAVNTWFKKYLRQKAKTKTTVHNFAAVEKKL